MSKFVRLFVSLLVVLCLVSAMAACGGASSTGTKAKGEPVKLTIWINGSDSYIGPDEQKKPQEEWYISKAFKRFEAENPGVTIELTVPPDPAEAHQTFKAAGLAKNAPDIANLWSGQNIFALKDVIAPLDGKVPKEDLENMMGWDTVRLGFKDDGSILGYPSSDNQLCFYLYNKKIISDAGLDFENNPPRTREDFDAAMEKIKAKNVTPIVLSESFPYYFCWIGAYWWVQTSGVESILKSCAGETKFADDKGLIDALAYYNSLWEKGYINKDAATSADAWNQFLQGKAAMTAQVSSVLSDAVAALGEDNVGLLKPQEFAADTKIKDGILGGPGQCLVVANSSKNIDMAVKFLHFLSSKKEVLEFLKVQQKVPVRKDITADEIGLKAGSPAAKLFSWSKDYVYFVDNQLTPSIAEEFYKLPTLVLVGKMTPQEMAAEMDKKAGK